jgi:hypothetical protein
MRMANPCYHSIILHVKDENSNVAKTRLIGIDFSGDVQQCSTGKQKSNVWIAVASTDSRGAVAVENLRTVQELPGAKHPFDRLIMFLASESFAAAAIDAPFSVPSSYVRPSHSHLLQTIATLEPDGRPFARGQQLIESVMPQYAPRGKKLWRRTESEWREDGVNVRSTLWDGPRGGAPFTVACLTLLHRSQLPIWPWSGTRHGCLVEAFPAAQLHSWNLPCIGYNGSTAGALSTRETIIRSLDNRGLRFPSDVGARMRECADALDAVIWLYAARAVAESYLKTKPLAIGESEGWIAVHR